MIFFWRINLKGMQIPVDGFQTPTYHHCTRWWKHIYWLAENVYSILNIKSAASGLDFFRLMLSQIPELRTPLFYSLTKSIRHSPDLLAANYSLREPALKTKACSSIDRFIMFLVMCQLTENSHLYLWGPGTPKMMASIHKDGKVGDGGTIGATWGWQSFVTLYR